jgi:N-acetylglucosaminyldiphosphoundecaprenol N-acetyl-beta-D-mannosaminyltransferase
MVQPAGSPGTGGDQMTTTVPVSPVGRRSHIFGVGIDAMDAAAALDRVFELADRKVPSQHVVLNAAKVVQMNRDEHLREIISGCDLINADGSSVVWASRLLRQPLPERVAGIDLFAAILGRAASSGHSVYFLGATNEVLAELQLRLAVKHPTLIVAGARNGYWSDDESVIAQVREAHPDFLFLAIPSPRKEYWLSENLQRLDVPFVMGVGGSFDVMAGKVRRAPRWVQRIGCEWLYRVWQEPRRMWKRYLFGNANFIRLTAREWRKSR